MLVVSSKTIYNAYDNSATTPNEEEKKSEFVTLRTAGIHIHFSINGSIVQNLDYLNKQIFDTNNRQHANNIIKQFDALFEEQFQNPTEDSQKRRTLYQKLGNYRICTTNTIGGVPTLEYRQLDSIDLSNKDNAEKLVNFIKSCQKVGMAYINQQFAMPKAPNQTKRMIEL